MTTDDLALRALAQDLANRPDWGGLLALEPRLRADSGFWIGVWAPLLALAAAHLGRDDARRYLDEAVAGGFAQPEILDGELERFFAADADWPAVVAAMAANLAPPALALLAWPELSLAHPVRLAAIAPQRVDGLRARLPEPDGSAWTTARELTRWASLAWEHAGSSHVEQRDALHVLDRAGAGERFACREYTIVLSQALNARRIPARGVLLLRPGYHTGQGRAHAVSEAWIDDLGSWVVLDGQNGMYWVDADGRPLGLRELREPGRARPDTVDLAGRAAGPDSWWPYFATASLTGVTVAEPPYPPLLEDRLVIECEQLRSSGAGTHPDLLELGVGIVDVAGRPAVVPVSRHPYALGFDVDGHRLGPGEAWPIPDAGDVATLATATPYGVFGRHELRYART